NVKLTNNGEIHNSSLGLFYQWYETEPFNVNANSDWEITFTAYSTKLGCTTASYSMFEKAAFLKIADRDGNPTDVRYRRLPSHLVRDCDDDAFPDGSEFPAFMNASAYIEAEFLGGRKKVEENASNGMALWVIKGERVELPVEALNFTNENFDALIRVRARTSDAGTMRLDTGDWEEEVNLTQGYSWYEFRCKLTSTTTLNLTVGGQWPGCDTTSALIDRLNIFDLTLLTSTGAVEGTLIHIANQGTFHIEVPQKAPLCSLSFHITAEPAINRIPTKSALVSVTTANETIIWSDVDGAITAFSLSTGNTFTVAKRASIPRNLTASEKILAWEEEISGTRYVCVARLMENAIVHTYSGSMPHVNDNTVVFLTVTRLGTEIHLVRLTNQGFEDVVLAPADGTGDVSYLYWELANPKISGTRILLKASRAGTDAILLLEFSDFVPAFSGSKFHVSVLMVMNQITGFEIWEEQVVYANGHALSALNLSTGESRFITDSLFVDFKLSGCFLALSRENLSRYGITLYDLATGREKWMGSFSSNPFFLTFSSNLLACWSPLSMEINYLRSGVSVDVGNDGTIEWLHNGFIVDETTANLLRRPVIFTHAAIYSLPVSIAVSGSATVSEIQASFTTFTDPFLPDTDFDGLSDGVEFESYFPVGIVHLEDALRFQFTEKCENSYLQFGVLLSARPGGHALLALPFDAGESGFYMLSNAKMETINGTFVGEGGELPPNLTEMLSISIIDQGGKEREGNLTWNLRCVHRNSTACFVKALFTVSASLSAGRYWLEIEIRPVMNLSLILEGKVELSRRGTNFLVPDTDFDGLVDGEEQVMGASPLAPDADHDGIPDSAEIEKGTSALARDTDMDGLRDCAEGNLLFPPQPQPSSYFERLLLFGSPFSYHPLFTSLEIPLMTSPTNPDSDNDGLPDGFIDGWRYYPDETGKYRAENWRNSGICDGKFQVWEFENLNLNGFHDNFTSWTAWDFNPSTFEVAHYFENGFIRFYGETDPLKPDTDGDCCLDGYEVLYATKEPYDRYWEPRKGGILHLLNPADPEDGARDVDIFEEEVAETRVGGGLDPPIEPSFVNFTINDTIPARAVVFDFAHVVELQRMSFSASSNSSRLAVLLYAGEFPDGCLVDERTIPVTTTMGNLSIDYSGFYLDRGYFVFRRAYPTDTEAFIGGLKFSGTPDPEIPQAQNFKYYQEGWQNLPLNQVYNFSLGNIPLNLQILSIDQNIQGWAVLIENPSARLISSIGIGLRPDDARAGDFVLEVREYGENVSVMDTPLLFTKRSALNGEGWYRVDIPDISLQNFYVVLRYAGERFYWKASFGEKLRHAFLLTNEGREFPVDINPCIKLYTYSGLSSNSARHGDGVNNSLEGIAGTNPLSENTDAFYSGCIFYDDSLNDSEELSMVVFRTNAVQGALTAANYREGVWVELRAEGLNGFTAVRYTCLFSGEVHIPAGTTLYQEYFRLYRLEDGSEFYRAPSGTNLILFSPALPADINQSYSGMRYLFALEPSATPTLALDPRPHPEYRDGELYVSSPFDIDTDDDGLRDGNEPFWNLDLESPNPYGVTDLLPGAHDPDSDGDGIMDSLEVDYLKDTDLDGFVNMVDADSDNDGVVDGKEVCWNLDTDGDGNANMVDNDADNDGLSDGIELNPYLTAQALQLTMNYEIYVDGCGIEFSKIFWFDFCADRLYVGYKDNGVEKIAEGKFERYRKEQYLHSLTIDITSQVFAVNHTGAIFTVSGGNLVGYVRKPDGSYEGRTIVRNVPPIRSIAVNLTTVFFATQQKVYAVPSHMENLLLENAQIISDSAFNAVTANEKGCYLAGESLIQMPDGCSINTPSSEKKGVCVLRDGSVVWATDSAIFLAQPPYSRFHSGLNTYTEVKSTEVKCLKSDAKDNIFILNDAAFVMIKYARTDMIASDTDGDGLWDGYDLGGHKGELSERVCQAVEVKTSSPKYAGYLENREIPLAPYVHAYAGFTDPTEGDSDGDGLSDLEEIEGWEIQVRDCALLVANSLDPLAAFTIPSSKPWYTINSYGDAEILSEAETVHTVHVNSNPLFTDTDCDGLGDSQESGFTN
ncbi:MAG: hypothetical protein QXJ27_05385, partial [Thermoplasmata archaeon]